MSGNWIVKLSPIAGVDFVVHHLIGSEELGRPFLFELEILADVSRLDQNLEDLLGESVTVALELPDERIRHFNGLVSEASFSGLRGQQASFTLTLRPWFWFLSKRSDCRIYQNMTVPDVVKQVFRDNDFSDFEDKLTGKYETREYCVQYRETTFDFVSRLLEDEGIYYYWSHKDGKHTMVLSDSYSAHDTIPGYDQIVFRAEGEAHSDQDCIDEWKLVSQVCTSNYSLDSYNYEKSRTDLAARSKISRSHALGRHERYDYGALYGTSKLGEASAKVRVQELNAQQTVGRAHGNARGVSCGALFSLADFPRSDQNVEYMVVDTEYFIANSEIETGMGDATARFDIEFTCIDSKTPFCPARVTPASLVRGPQTAVVVGKAGEEIWTDEFGRVKVQFHWDDEGKKDENSSCWIRVAQVWAGKGWGAIAIPRIGQEVVVDFLEGDPDQPLITGSVYNDEYTLPYKLPDNKTQSGVKTRSTKQGDKNTFNELRFEDKKGAEEVYFHAERDFNRVVENNDTLKVGLEDKEPGNQTIEIHNDRTVTLNEGNDKLTVEKKDRIVKISSGNDSLDVAKKISIKAGDMLEIKVGKASLTMKKNGDIDIKGKTITIDAMMQVNVKATKIQIDGKGTADIKAPKTSVEGQGMLDLKSSGMAKLKGSITMIG